MLFRIRRSGFGLLCWVVPAFPLSFVASGLPGAVPPAGVIQARVL
ncbi:hypothetical protein GCM10010412_014830 [Nonomuraea recticatena]|uniref:Uncharacterized protein n=1 Tax=Nonomuraea recticatena TaxID=46178 RepID=A0ABN3RDP9_9ACTN